ncbi:undecaprenyl-diphosphate phosphatase [Thermococcus stetteri]|uniref:undecaprenyl-diphosphate phosphatase n=1 Tax=Thermococcus stetteri TaxID=49900 RepID=UPI001AE7884E|nr:undecaprenyl-diphosphate phosphatase [Thermococcus stetteri]MBP1912757.1 undecaprenyl-diphosphatase [Thermococcus stetteri]
MLQGIAEALLSGILAALLSWLPTSPEGTLASHLDKLISYTAFLVPSYAGIMFSVLYRYRERLSKESLMAIRGVQESELQYFILGFFLTLLMGFPLARLLNDDGEVFDVFNLILAVIITLFGLTWPRLAIMRRTESKIPTRPSFLDAVLGGLFQGFSCSGEASRTGLVTLALLLPGHKSENVLEWGFLIAPAYHLTRLLYLGAYSGNTLLGFISAVTAFFVSLVVMEALVRTAHRLGTEKFLTLFGLIGLLLNLGVLI